jgi:hypothetical protein
VKLANPLDLVKIICFNQVIEGYIMSDLQSKIKEIEQLVFKLEAVKLNVVASLLQIFATIAFFLAVSLTYIDISIVVKGTVWLVIGFTLLLAGALWFSPYFITILSTQKLIKRNYEFLANVKR